jgi:hypothetical protein
MIIFISGNSKLMSQGFDRVLHFQESIFSSQNSFVSFNPNLVVESKDYIVLKTVGSFVLLIINGELFYGECWSR